MEDVMAKILNKEKLKEFLFRRRINFLTLVAITLLSVVITVVCLMTGFIPNRVNILVIVSVLLVLLCCLQAYRMRKSFRTIKAFRGLRKKKQQES